MFKKHPFLKWVLGGFAIALMVITFFVIKIIILLPSENKNLKTTTANNIPYLIKNKPETRGKILTVVTSTKSLGNTEKKTGYELTELAKAYYVFKANGFEVDIASPLGGEPPVIIDDEDMGAFDYAFLNDRIAQNKVVHSLQLENVNSKEYIAVYFVGGKGAMFDFPNNTKIQSLIKEYHSADKVIGAVCHGPAALVNVTLENGQSFVSNRKVSGFTNKEELLLIPKAKSIFPFLLQDKLIEQGAEFQEGVMYLEKVSSDDKLITGQNPWSVWILAEEMVKQLGYTPEHRIITAEENAVKVLDMYYAEGSIKAKALIKDILQKKNMTIDIALLLDHSIISILKMEFVDFNAILSLASYSKKQISK